MGHDNPNDTPTQSSDRRGDVSRRRLISSGAAAWATVSLAGCNYITDPGTPSGSGGSGGSGGGSGGSGGSGGDGGDGGDTGGSGTGGTGGNTTVTNETSTTDDTSTADGTSTGTPCESSRQFFPGMEIGLNVNVFDSDTGEFLGADEVDSVTVEFPNADYGPLEMNWRGDHEEFSEEGWGAKIETDEDIEPGTYRYEIEVDAGENSDVVTDQFTIL